MPKLTDRKNEELQNLMVYAKLILRENKHGETAGCIIESLGAEKIDTLIERHSLKSKIILLNYLERRQKSFDKEHKESRNLEDELTLKSYDYIHDSIVDGIATDFNKVVAMIRKYENRDNNKVLLEKSKIVNYIPRLSKEAKEKLETNHPTVSYKLKDVIQEHELKVDFAEQLKLF